MSVYALVFSPTGGTQKVADIVAIGVDPKCQMIDLMSRETEFSTISFTAEDICIVAVPSFGGRVPDIAVQRVSAVKGGGAAAIAVVAYGNRAIDDTMLELVNVLKAAGFRCAGGISAVAEHSIVRQFGAGRPDTEDVDELRAMAAKIAARIKAGEIPEDLTVPGEEPYKPYGGVPLKPIPDKEACVNCGACARKCPVGAIPADDPCKPDDGKCISCMACIAVCPRGARKLDENFVGMIAKGMAEACGGHKANELFM